MKLSVSQLRRIIKEEVSRMLVEQADQVEEGFLSNVGAFAKGMMGSTSQERQAASAGPQNVVALGQRKTLKGITTNLVAAMQELENILVDDYNKDPYYTRRSISSLSPSVQLAKEIDASISTSLTKEGIGDMLGAAKKMGANVAARAGEIASNVKGVAKDYMAQSKDPLLGAISKVRKLIYSITSSDLSKSIPPEVSKKFMTIDVAVSNLQKELSKLGRKTYGN